AAIDLQMWMSCPTNDVSARGETGGKCLTPYAGFTLRKYTSRLAASYRLETDW
ncbi:MAG: hypothetical protein ACI835_003781, partial [Planctomycetota bacterium]